MKVLFINPPFLPRFSRESRSPSVTKSNTMYYPHWLCYAAAYVCKNNDVEIDVIDAAPLNIQYSSLAIRIKNFAPDIVVIDTSTPSIYSDLTFASNIKKESNNAIMVMVGPHVSATINETFEYCQSNKLNIDFILHGEYEKTLSELIEAIRNKKTPYDIKGLAFQKSGEIKVNGKNDFLHELDNFKFVSEIYNKFLNIPDYFMAHTKYPMVTLISGRGCTSRCSFCQLPQVMHGHEFRTRSVDNLIDELKYIKSEMPFVKGIMFEDDTFPSDKQRVLELCEKIVENGLDYLEYTCNARANVSRGTLNAMHKAGFRMMCVGFESGDQVVLNAMRKGTKRNIIKKFVADSKIEGVKVHGCFMYGNKGETKETLTNTLDFALNLDIDSAQFYPIMVSPGTEDYEYYKEKKLLKSEDFSQWNDAQGQHKTTILREEITDDELEQFCDYSRRRFYLRPKYIFMKGVESIFDYSHLKKNIRGAAVLLRHLVYKPGASL